MESPRPVPPYLRVDEGSSWLNGLKSWLICRVAMPIPVSFTENWRARDPSAASARRSVTVTSSPSTLTLSPRQVSSTTVTIASLNGFAQPVTLTVSGLPLGVTAALTPSSLAGGAGVSTLTLTLGNKPALGTFVITVTATSGMIVHTSAITLIIAK